MVIASAISATPGPVAPDYAQTRAAVAATGRGDSIRHESARHESAGSADGEAAPGGKDDKSAQAVVNPTFRYDDQSGRMVMLMRDQKTGATLVQVPSEVALRQYEQALKRVRDEVAASQDTAATPAPASTSSLEAATLGVVMPAPASAGSLTVGASARPGGARFNIMV